MVRLGILFLIFTTFFINDKSITWSENKRLTWNDFLAEPDAYSDAVATTASGITFGYRLSTTDGKAEAFKGEATAHFYPEKSWVKITEANDHILAHEQLHFDITELHARKLRQAMQEIKISDTIEKVLNSTHFKINQDLTKMQDRYDAESDYSRNKEEQAKWQAYIKKELSILSAYK